MICFLFWFITLLEGDEVMMAMFFAQRVILEKTKYSEVPSLLQSGVHEILIDSGFEFLIEE